MDFIHPGSALIEVLALAAIGIVSHCLEDSLLNHADRQVSGCVGVEQTGN